MEKKSEKERVHFAFHVLCRVFPTPARARFMLVALPIILCTFFVASCGGKAVNFELSSEDTEKLNLILEKLQVRYELTSTLIMGMRVTIEDKGKKEEVREHLWYKKSETDGELLHIQALGAYNEPRVVVIAARGQFLLRLINENEAYFQPLEDGVLREIFGMDLRVSDVRNAIFANPFLDGNTDKLSLTHSGAKYVVTRSTVGGEQTEEITIFVRNDEPKVQTWLVRNKDGTIIQRTKFSDYREVGGLLYPHKVEIERPLEQTRVVFKVVKPEINTAISDKKFDFERFLEEDTKIRRLPGD